MQAQSDDLSQTIKNMKQGLSHIVQNYKYSTVDAFLQVYKQGKSEYDAMLKLLKNGNPSTEKNLSAEKQAKVEKQEQERET